MGGRERGREGGRKGEREGGREGEREGGRGEGGGDFKSLYNAILPFLPQSTIIFLTILIDLCMLSAEFNELLITLLCTGAQFFTSFLHFLYLGVLCTIIQLTSDTKCLTREWSSVPNCVHL